MNKILITGSAGFIGFHLQKELRKNCKVVGIDNLKSSASLERNNLIENSKNMSIHTDFLNELDEIPDVVIHLAAETGIAGSTINPHLYFHQNIEGTYNVLEQCRKNGVKFLLYASSSSVYEPNQFIMNELSPSDKQLSFYGTTKKSTEIIVENYCKQFGMIAIGLRFFTVYGSWTRPDMAAYKFMKLIDIGNPITLYNEGNVFRDFTHVNDIVKSISLLIDKIKNEDKGFHEVFNIGFGSPISVKDYAEMIAKKLNKEIYFESKCLPLNELVSTYCDNSKLESYINFKPIFNFEEGITEMTDWFKSHRYD
jgi:UDP-glucuronate 4-epimerase